MDAAKRAKRRVPLHTAAIKEHAALRLDAVGAIAPRQEITDIVLFKKDVAKARKDLRLVAPEPKQLRQRPDGIRLVEAFLQDLVTVNGKQLLCLRSAAAVRPMDRGAQRTELTVARQPRVRGGIHRHRRDIRGGDARALQHRPAVFAQGGDPVYIAQTHNL